MKIWPGICVHTSTGESPKPSLTMGSPCAATSRLALHMALHLALGAALCLPARASHAAFSDGLNPRLSPGFSTFASVGFTQDSNLLNRSTSGTGPQPQSDTVTRTELGATLDTLISRQRLRAKIAVNQNRHAQFTDRNVDGQSHDLQWDANLGETVQGQFEVARDRDQAPIQTGQTNAVERIQNTRQAKLVWGFHPEYAVTAQFQQADSEFLGTNSQSDPLLAGLERHENLHSMGLAYLPATGSQLGIAFKTLDGDFPSRQITGPGQTVSNNFQQHEVELSSIWNASDITRISAAISRVERRHNELPVRNYQGVNYQLEAQFRPTAKTQFIAAFARQIIGVSDVSNSDALARQISLALNWAITPTLLLNVTHRPQTLYFNGTDGFSTQARTDRLRDNSIRLEYTLTPRIMLLGIAQQRQRQSTQVNTDYSAVAYSLYLKYVY